MIVQFPDRDRFRLALAGGLVPPDLLGSPARAAAAPDGPVALEVPLKRLPAAWQKLGASAVRTWPAEPRDVAAWAEAVPLDRAPGPPQITPQTPVIFELDTAADLAAVAGEMLRLGNDRQALRWVRAGDAERAQLRVAGPPYYTLLRALEEADGVRAYVEQAPRFWVRLGHRHPLADRFAVDAGRAVFADPPGDWRVGDDAGWQDIYQSLELKAPAGPSAWAPVARSSPIPVPLRLAAGPGTDAPELWVLAGDALDALDAFVRDADDRILRRLKFAAGKDADGREIVVLRLTPSKLPPPALEFADAVGYRPFWKLPNLFVPAGTRLHPPLRRDRVRELLAPDPDTLVWLRPDAAGRFAPQTLPEDSFRPLEDWVDYVVAAEREALTEWVAATEFDFESFVCNEAGGPKPKEPPADPARKPGKGKPAAPAPAPAPTPDAPLIAELAPAPAPARTAAQRDAEQAAARLARTALQDEFLNLPGPLDAPERQALWPKLAAANAACDDHGEAAVCWLDAVWNERKPPAEWWGRWLAAERGGAPPADAARRFRELLALPEPQPEESREFAALVAGAAATSPPPAWLTAELPKATSFARAAERHLPLRAAWLLASHLARLNGGDPLALARARDRVLQRLLEDGVSAERDLPYFLRAAGRKDGERVRAIRDQCRELHRVARTWAEKGTKPSSAAQSNDAGATAGYVDLFFALALARLGEEGAAKALILSGREALANSAFDEKQRGVAALLLDGFRYRAEQALAGKATAGPLPAEFRAGLDALAVKGGGNDARTQIHYGVQRMLEQSRLLEPQEKLDPYTVYMGAGDAFRKAIADLRSVADPQLLAKRVRELYRGADGKAAPDARMAVLREALPLSGRAGEAFSVELLGLVPEAMRAGAAVTPAPVDLPKKQGELLEPALFVAAHFDRRDLVRSLVDEFVRLTAAKADDGRYELVNYVAGQCLRSLRKLDLQDEVRQLLARLEAEVLKGMTVPALKQKLGARPDLWAKALQSLLYIASGWQMYGGAEKARPVLDEGRHELLKGAGLKLQPQEYTRLAQAYVAAAGRGPAEDALPRLRELLADMPPNLVRNTYTTAPYYSRLHLNVIEEMVLALASDDFGVGPAGHRWLEEDEYLIRRRVHRDVRGGVTE